LFVATFLHNYLLFQRNGILLLVFAALGVDLSIGQALNVTQRDGKGNLNLGSLA
jgi:hypothetical protein